MPPHYYVRPENIRENKFLLTGSEARHVTCVLRKKPGDVLCLFDGKGHGYWAELEEVSPTLVRGTILRPVEWPKPSVALHLLQGLPKSSKMDEIIEKGTELGFQSFWPVLTERCEVRLKNSEILRRHQRWERVALAASKQCGRSEIPMVSVPLSLSACFQKLPSPLFGIMPWESQEHLPAEGGASSFKKILQTSLAGQREIYLLIGPEGGFTPQEVEQSQARGFVPVSLGPRILRTETAGLVTGAAIFYEAGEL